MLISDIYFIFTLISTALITHAYINAHIKQY